MVDLGIDLPLRKRILGDSMDGDNGSVEIVTALLKRGARVNALTESGATALDLAEGKATAKFLADHGARVGGFAEDGESRLPRVGVDLDRFRQRGVGQERPGT